MNEINELLRTLYPKGIEFKELGEICVFRKGNSLSKADKGQGDIPIILYGELYTTYNNYITNIISSTSEDRAQTATTASKGNLLLPISSTTKEAKIGKASVICVDSPVYIGGDTLILEHQQCAGYLVHLINSNWFEKQKMMCVHGTTIMHLHPKELAKIRIPIPPLAVQEEIVRILDKLTELETELEEELEKELEARKKQYEWYRDRLLSFDNETEYLPLGTIFNVRNGYTPPKANAEFWEGGMIPWFRMEDIRKNGRFLYDALQHVTPAAVKRGTLFPANSLIISTTATIGEHALLKTEGLTNQQITNCSLKPEYADKICLQFAFYYFFKLGEWCKENANLSGGLAIIGTEKIKQFLFPVPPIEEQRRIVAILDRLDTLCNDITTGLPAEIVARRKQYEYYRDKLLSFKEVA